MNKTFIFSLFIAFLFIGCCDDTKSEKAKLLRLYCINGYVFKGHKETKILDMDDITLEPLNIECSNGKVIVD